MSVREEIIQNPTANTKCPSCDEKFKPFECLPKQQQMVLLNRKEKAAVEKEEGTIINEEEGTIISEAKKQPLGWLLVHDEKTHLQTYDLFEGTQLIGRKSASRPCDVMIETGDRLMSRNHFVVEVKQTTAGVVFYINDHNSLNKTYVETKALKGVVKQLRLLKKGEQAYAEDGDIVQAGETKLILKSGDVVANKTEATKMVASQEISKTVIVC